MMCHLSSARVSSLAAATLAASLLAGCHVTSHHNGGNDNVDIGTPFGSMQVKTNDNVDATGIGITPYPGATLVKKDKDNGAADVNMSFGSFHLGVKAASFLTTDARDKVLAFYRDDLKRYGDVIECQGRKAVGQPTRTAEGLTCDFEEHGSGHMSFDEDSNQLELRAGSKQHQHIVALEDHDNGTKIGLVALDLPSGLDSHGHQKQSE